MEITSSYQFSMDALIDDDDTVANLLDLVEENTGQSNTTDSTPPSDVEMPPDGTITAIQPDGTIVELTQPGRQGTSSPVSPKSLELK